MGMNPCRVNQTKTSVQTVESGQSYIPIKTRQCAGRAVLTTCAQVRLLSIETRRKVVRCSSIVQQQAGMDQCAPTLEREKGWEGER